MMIVRFNSWVQINNDYYIRTGECFEEVKGKKIKIKGFEEFDLFAHQVEKSKLKFWCVSDAISGCRIGKLYKTLPKAIKGADNLLYQQGSSRAEFRIREVINNKFISPRYRFVANPNSIRYVAIKRHKNPKSTFPRRYRVQIQEE